MIRPLVCLALVCLPSSLIAQDENNGDQLVTVRVAILQLKGDFQLNDRADYSEAVFDELIASLRKQKVLEHYRYFDLASVENRPATVRIGQEQPVVTGRRFSPARDRDGRGFARATNIYEWRDTGSSVQVVPRVRDDGKILVELTVESTRLKAPQKLEPEEGDNSRPSSEITPPAIETIRCNTAVLLDPGVSTIVSSGGRDDDEETSRDFIIVTAMVK